MVKFTSVAVHCGVAAPAAIATSPRHEPGAPSVVPKVLVGGAPHHPDVGCGAATAASRRRGANVASWSAAPSSTFESSREPLGTWAAASCTCPRDCDSDRSAVAQAASAHNASSESARRERHTAASSTRPGGSSCAAGATAVRCLNAHSARGAIRPHTSARAADRAPACQLFAQQRCVKCSKCSCQPRQRPLRPRL